MGAPGLEPGTSALSGPRSNQLSYAPGSASDSADDGEAAPRVRVVVTVHESLPGCSPAGRRSCRWLDRSLPIGCRPELGPCGADSSHTCLTWDASWSRETRGMLPRKEVIQPQLPLRLPCYDFVPIIHPTLDGCLLAVGPPASGVADFRDVTDGVYKARERIHRGNADPRLLVTPPSRGRVAARDLN